ncbi:MAG: polysaccharide biosynthesis tyrosine autokinase [Bacteroidota bacterium]|nr:polysaccharide biosynthesis tyrosine autokinase [Bacteroidota bacterium]
MFDLKDFSFSEAQTSVFDIKGFLIKLLSYWKWFVVCIILFMIVAYQVNIRKEKIYALDALITIKEEKSPLLSSSTNVIFNWGGGSDKQQEVITMFTSRNHNEQVVEKLEYYIDYLTKNKYNYVDAYGHVPFYVELQKDKPQAMGQLIKIKFLNEKEYKLDFDLEDGKTEFRTTNYTDYTVGVSDIGQSHFSKVYTIGEDMSLPFINAKIKLFEDKIDNYVGNEYFIRFQNFNSVVQRYQSIRVAPLNKNSNSLIKLSLQGTNKNRIVEYINSTVEVLIDNELASKNQFAVNTIKFIDSTFARIQEENIKTSLAMKDFTRDKNIYEIPEISDGILSSRLTQYDTERDLIQRKLQYYNTLKTYLDNTTDFSKLPAPSIAGIEDLNIVSNVTALIEMSIKRTSDQYGIKNTKLYEQLDAQMEALKLVLLENIQSAKKNLEQEQKLINSKIADVEKSIRKMPLEKQEYLEILRKYNLEQEILSDFMSKRNDAEIMKVSNLPDIHFIDKAKDIGDGLVGPKTNINYVLALLFGLLVPTLIVFVMVLFDNSIKNSDEVKRLSKVPILGIIPRKNKDIKNLTVLEHPQNSISESFRTIRTQLQYYFRKNKIEGTKTILLTSSISGEGKTYCSINIASVFAMSEKKTVLVGLDLRKPKIFDDFGIDNKIGVVNYIYENNTLDEVIQQTQNPFLDVIVSGPVPPNPSELLIGEMMHNMITELKDRYEYVIIDTSPAGLVSDAMELVGYSDITLYVVRQNVTRKPMLSIPNEKQRKDELPNLHFILNAFESKTKYGYGYGNYGYGGYGVEEKKISMWQKILYGLKLRK